MNKEASEKRWHYTRYSLYRPLVRLGFVGFFVWICYALWRQGKSGEIQTSNAMIIWRGLLKTNLNPLKTAVASFNNLTQFVQCFRQLLPRHFLTIMNFPLVIFISTSASKAALKKTMRECTRHFFMLAQKRPLLSRHIHHPPAKSVK